MQIFTLLFAKKVFVVLEWIICRMIFRHSSRRCQKKKIMGWSFDYPIEMLNFASRIKIVELKRSTLSQSLAHNVSKNESLWEQQVTKSLRRLRLASTLRSTRRRRQCQQDLRKVRKRDFINLKPLYLPYRDALACGGPPWQVIWFIPAVPVVGAF